MTRGLKAIASAVLVLCLTAGAQAQRRGGSFGGSRGFRSSSSGSSSRGSSGSFGSGSSFGSRPSRSRSFGSGSPRPSNSFGSSSAFGSSNAFDPSDDLSDDLGSSPTFHDPTPHPTRQSQARDPRFRSDHIPPPGRRSGYRRPEPLPGDPVTGAAPVWEATTLTYPDADGPMRWKSGAVAGGITFLVLGFAWLLIGRARRLSVSDLADAVDAPPPPSRAQGTPCEVRRLSLGFDWTRRRELQAGLEALAGRYDMSSAEGMYTAATKTVELLLSAVNGARYAAFTRQRLGPDDAQSFFSKATYDLRARFKEETVIDDRRRSFGEMRARAEEGEGLVVVSIVIGSMVHLPELPGVLRRESVQHALSTSLPDVPDDLVALEVVWSPSEDQDRMSSAELEVVYPELLRLDDAGGVGRLNCGYCHAVYPAELGRCPACGAPADA